MPSLCIQASYETSRPLFSTLSDVRHVCNSYDWAQSFESLRELSLLFLLHAFFGTSSFLLMVLTFLRIV